MENQSSKYSQRGVSSQKEDVHQAIKDLDKGLFPKAFCKIIPDFLSGSEEHCVIMHADGAGTKSSLAYLYWKETGDLSVWKGIAQDALIMNIDDLLCVGAADVPILVSSTIGRNKNLIPAEVISALIQGTQDLIDELNDNDIKTLDAIIKTSLRIKEVRANDVMFREPLNPSLDGNTVEMAVEQMEFSENVVRYQTTLQFLTNKISGLMSAIKGE